MSALNIRNFIQVFWVFLAIAQTQLVFRPKLIRCLSLHLKFKIFKHFYDTRLFRKGQERDLKQALYQKNCMVKTDLQNLF